MPTKKPTIQAIVEETTYTKFKYIMKKEKRSNAQMAAIMIESYIENYEAEHGEISLENLAE